MNPLLLPFLSYAIVTTFTPGPNNVMVSTLGARLGYRRTLPCLLGITAGFFMVLFVSGLLTDFLLRTWTVLAPWVRWIGVAYMLWLAISLFLPHPGKESRNGKDVSFLSGFFLQFANPKGILYGITIYTSFSTLIAGSLVSVSISAAALSLLGFLAISVWTMSGVGLGKIMTGPRGKLVFNVVMALLLVWCAWSIAAH